MNPNENKPFDPFIQKFLILADKPESTREALMECLAFMREFMSFSLIGPFYGTILGLVDAGRLPENYYNVITPGMVEGLIDMPGYNDFLMYRWIQKHDISLVRAMLRRTEDPDPAISETAVWMICSVAEQDPEFLRQMIECGCTPCKDSRGELGFFRTQDGARPN